MVKVDTFSIKGTKLGSASLPREFGEEVNLKLLAQAIHIYEDKGHTGLAKAKTRAEVNRTKKKWYRQKGTGGARHGARSAPIFVGGGAAHGPRPVRRELFLPERMAKKALNSAFSTKVKNKEIVLVSGLSKLAKTKEANGLINKLVKSFPGVKKFTFVLSDESKKTKDVLRNLKRVSIVRFRDLNVYRVFFGGLLVLDKEIFEKKK